MLKLEESSFSNLTILINNKPLAEIDPTCGLRIGHNTLDGDVVLGIKDLADIQRALETYFLTYTIDELKLSVPSQVQLHTMKIETVKDLCSRWKQIREQLNKESFVEIRGFLEKIGLSFTE